MSALSRNMNAWHMSKVLPPQMLKQIGGMGGLQNFMKQMILKDMGGLVGSSDEGTNTIYNLTHCLEIDYTSLFCDYQMVYFFGYP